MEAISKIGNLAGNSFSHSLITLLPKKPEHQGAKDYRPISLLHSIAKIFSKILTRRLASEMAKIVAPNQSAFISARSIQDNYSHPALDPHASSAKKVDVPLQA